MYSIREEAALRIQQSEPQGSPEVRSFPYKWQCIRSLDRIGFQKKRQCRARKSEHAFIQ